MGPQRLPELGRTIGKAMREFRKIQDDVKDTVNSIMGDELQTDRTSAAQDRAELRALPT